MLNRLYLRLERVRERSVLAGKREGTKRPSLDGWDQGIDNLLKVHWRHLGKLRVTVRKVTSMLRYDRTKGDASVAREYYFL